MQKLTLNLLIICFISGLSTACGAAPAGLATSEQPLNISFQAAVNGQPFRCGQDYAGVGSSRSNIRARDFRFYLSAPRLVQPDGQEVPITLNQDGKWQYKTVALLDFEDGTAGCEGNPDTNFQLKGTVPAGSLKPGSSLRFELGVPFELNHGDASRAASPLNLTSMFWTWRGGYKFARLDLTSTGQPQGYFIHLGSTGCTGEMGVQHEDHEAAHGAEESSSKPPAQCSAPNRASITLSAFDPLRHKVEADLGKLLQDSDVNLNQPETPGGCMSGADDSDCAGIFKQLGLGTDKTYQGFFSLK